MEKKDLSGLRQEYAGSPLLEHEVDRHPLLQFGRWFEQAVAAGLPEPNAMTLATVGQEGTPAARVVLLKEVDAQGFVFYTNYLSNKGRELQKHPHAALVFLWLELQRQVRVEGHAEVISGAESDAYFMSRPPESRLGAIASPQSREIPSREYLEERYGQVRKEYEAKPLTRPHHWGGYRLIPRKMEFWQGRQNRLHDRIVYLKHEADWLIRRLAP